MVDGADELRFLAGELRAAGARNVLAELRDGLKRAAGPAAEAAQRSILATPSKHPGDLRAGIAETVKVTTSLTASAARVQVSATGPPRWPGAAAKFEAGRWNHPVFGRPEHEAQSVALQKIHGRGFGHGRGWTWVKQQGPEGWFERAVAAHQAEFDQAVDRVADKLERRMAGEA
jgi:hypothetical protein